MREHQAEDIANKSFIPLRENYQAVSIQDYSTCFLLYMSFHCVFEVSVWQPNFIESFVLQNKGVVSIAKGQPGLVLCLPHIDVGVKFLRNRFHIDSSPKIEHKLAMG